MSLSARFALGSVVVTLAVATLSHAAAPAGRYTVSTGTVVDTRTKLTWQRNASTSTFAWADAKGACASVGASLGGTGWRLPTLKELMTLVDFTQSTSPFIDATAFQGALDGIFWTSTASTSPANTAWAVSFDAPATGAYDVTDPYPVLCVR
jgi:hypothetical protein